MSMDTQEAGGIAASVTENLRALRQDRNLTLDELAKRSGVSRTMLHQVETGRSTPSISVLWKISTGLGVPFSQLIQEQHRPGPVVLRQDHAKLLFNHEQTFSTRALFPFDGSARSTEFYELVIKPSGIETADAHAVGTVEYIILTEGSALIIEVDGRPTELKRRDAMVFKADVPHVYRNPDPVREAVAYLVMTYAAPTTG